MTGDFSFQSIEINKQSTAEIKGKISGKREKKRRREERHRETDKRYKTAKHTVQVRRHARLEAPRRRNCQRASQVDQAGQRAAVDRAQSVLPSFSRAAGEAPASLLGGGGRGPYRVVFVNVELKVYATRLGAQDPQLRLLTLWCCRGKGSAGHSLSTLGPSSLQPWSVRCWETAHLSEQTSPGRATSEGREGEGGGFLASVLGRIRP